MKTVWAEGIVEDIVFRNEDNGYTICDVRGGENGIFTAVGYMPCLSPGEKALFEGVWEEHSSYGSQLKVTYYESSPPEDGDDIIAYLSSGLIPGIRLATAEKIVDKFGADSLLVLEEEPERLAEIKGISKKKALEASEAYKQTKSLAASIIFLQKYGLSAKMAAKVCDVLGANAARRIKDDPYILSDRVEGVGFKTADNIASSLGVAKNDMRRIRSGMRWILQNAAYNGGHTYLPEETLLDTAEYGLEVSRSELMGGESELLGGKELFADTASGRRALYSAGMYQAEFYTARRLLSMRDTGKKCPLSPEQLEEHIRAIALKNGVELAVEQFMAVQTSASCGCMALTGGPGTGKTTTINTIIALMEELGRSVVLTAPTGRAAKRMSQVTGMEAKTIHRLLECKMDGRTTRFERDENNPLSADVVIADEVSMIDQQLMSSLLKAIKPGAQLIMSGDADQLPSVGAGNVLHDMIDSGAIPVIRLEKIFRQAKESLIITNAHRINRGEMPELTVRDRDFFFLRRLTAADTARTIAELYAKRLPASYGVDPIESIQVLSPTKKGPAGTLALNRRLQQLVNPPDPMKSEYAYGTTTFRSGDKVMQIKNNYDLEYCRHSDDGQLGQGIYNGDMGVIQQISAKDKFMLILFDDDRLVEYPFSALEELELAYAVTVHKSQGSEFPIVVLSLAPCAPALMYRNLLYTAVTRAKDMVVAVGDPDTIAHMVANGDGQKRYTSLAERLRALDKEDGE